MSLNHFFKYFSISREIISKRKSISLYEQLGEELINEYKQKGYIRKKPFDMLKIGNVSFAAFLDFLISQQGTHDDIKTPVFREQDSSWMSRSSFCFMNIRGTGMSKHQTGNLIDAAKLLPVLRVNSIHLAPFFECALEIIYGVDSLKIIDENIVNKTYLRNGMSAEEQLRFFVDTAHLLDKTVGFDIEPHTSQFSRTAIQNPSLFRWIKLNPSRTGLFNNIEQEEMLKPDHQNNIHEEIKSLLNNILNKYSLESLEETDKAKECKKAHQDLIHNMIENGLWALPSHTWKGAGLPEFTHYDEKGYPEFKYLSWDSENHREHAFGTLTPFRFYDNIPLNKVPDEKEPPKENPEVVQYFTEIFPRLHNKYNFDFIRFDYVDHVFDSVINGHPNQPISDRLTPSIIEKTIKRARDEKPYIGAMAERMGTDIEDYHSIGFDLILGTDILSPINSEFVLNILNQNREIEEINKKWDIPGSIQFAVDTHDTGHPLFNITPMVKYGRKGVALRQCLARFSGWGVAIRPKYEVIGNQDGTIGLYQANNHICSVQWKKSNLMNKTYHNIEDVYEELLPYLKKGKLEEIHTPSHVISYWEIRGDNFCIIPVVNKSKYSRTGNINIKTDFKYQSAELIDPYKNTRETCSELNIEVLYPLEFKIVFCKA